MTWSATASAHYVASTATSGALSVSDGAGHSVILQLINYFGDGTFFVQNDGNGGTLVFDPPAAPAASSETIAEASKDKSFDVAIYHEDSSALSDIDVNLAFGIVTGDAANGADTSRSVEGVRESNSAATYIASDFSAAGFLNAFVNKVESFGTLNEFKVEGGNEQITGNGNTHTAFSSASDDMIVELVAGICQGTAVGDLAGVGTGSFTGVNAVRGSGFSDLIFGDAVENTLEGQGGNETIEGRSGADSLIGGGGADRFVFRAGADSTVAASDSINDLVHGLDIIDMSAGSGVTSVQGLMDGTTQLAAHSVGWVQGGADTIICTTDLAAAQDQAAADMKIMLTEATVKTLTSSDFFPL